MEDEDLEIPAFLKRTEKVDVSAIVLDRHSEGYKWIEHWGETAEERAARLGLNDNKVESHRRASELYWTPTGEATQLNVVMSHLAYQEACYNKEFDLYKYLRANEVTQGNVKLILEYYEPRALAYDDMPDDEDPTESFARLGHIYNKWVDDCNTFLHNKKVVKVRKPRAVKTKSATKQTERVNYMKEYGPLKLVSVNPASIIGAKYCWLYNTKVRTLQMVVAGEGKSLEVSGTSIRNVHPKLSIQKTLRENQVAATLKHVLEDGNVYVKKVLDEVKTKPAYAAGRINADTIILRVLK